MNLEDLAHVLQDEIGECKDENPMSDLHLNNAINLDIVEYLVKDDFKDYNIFVAHFQKKLWRDLEPFPVPKEQLVIGLLECTQDLLQHPSKKISMGLSLYKQMIEIVGKSLLNRGIKIPISDYYSQICSNEFVVNGVYKECFSFMLKLVCMVSEASRGHPSCVYNGFQVFGNAIQSILSVGDLYWKVTCNNQFCSIYDMKKKKCYVANFDSILLIMDTLGQRLCLEIGCQVAEIGKVDGTLSIPQIEAVMAVGDYVLSVYGNDGYEFIALFEALVVSALLNNNPDPITKSKAFHKSCRRELEEMIDEGTFSDDILSHFDNLYRFLISLDNSLLSNLFCIYRIWGHPRVNISQGMEKVMKKGTANKFISSEISTILSSQFKKMFVIGYFDKHHKYPPLIIDENLNDGYLKSCIDGGIPIHPESHLYNFNDWKGVKLKKLWNIPTTYDVCHILNDKAVSPTRSELYKSVCDGKGAQLGVNRRGILRWLLGDSIRCKEFLDTINDHGLDEDSLIIGMYEKEREIKIKARMFSLMSERMRMYFVLTEELIAEHLLKYFPQITMKDPLHVQIKKLWSVSGASFPTSIDPVINVDFEKWNLNFRKELTEDIFRDMDSLFGYESLIGRTHEIFENSFIYSSSGKYLPKISGGFLLADFPMAYIGHKGGFEGLRQKGWTIATVCLLCYLSDQQKISMNLLGQGDNQVVRLFMPHNYWKNLGLDEHDRIESSKNILRDYLLNMNTYFQAAGLPIKTRETWCSTRLCMYGKYMFVDGKCLPQWVKKLLRSYALTNEGTLTVTGVIGTLATNMSAAAHASSSPDIMYCLFLILGEWSLQFLFAYHPFIRKSIREGDVISFRLQHSESKKETYQSGRINRQRLSITLLMIPTSVGGCVTIPLTSFIMRGFPDHASEGYSWLKLLSEVESRWKSLFSSWYTFLVNPTIEHDMLIQSPWSLNHKKPPTPGLQSRDVIRDWLLGGIFNKNTFIKNVHTILGKFDRKEVCRLMCTEEVNPLILNELYNTFPHVYLDGVLRRVENTRTLKKMSMKDGLKKTIIRQLMEMEYEFIGYLHWRGNQKGTIFSNCSTQQCREARDKGWGRVIKGLTTPHPLEYCFDKICTSQALSCDGSDYVYVKIDNRCSFPPYLGSNVRTKVHSLQDLSARGEPLVAISSKLARYSPWLKLGENAKSLLLTNVNIVCNTEIYENFMNEESTYYSGSVEHRYNPACASEGCFINYSPQVGTSVFISTDNLFQFGKGQQNVTMSFQALFCFLQYVSARRFDVSCMHYHLYCRECIRDVDEDCTDISDCSKLLTKLYDDVSVQKIRETLGYIISKETLDLSEEQKRSNLIHQVSKDNLKISHTYEGVLWFLGLKASKMIMYTQKTTSNMIGLEDLQTFPRVYSFRISSSKIVKIIAYLCLVIKRVRMLSQSDYVPFNEVKRKLRSQLIKATLDRFKGAASLCVGRTFSLDDGEAILYFNSGEYPDTVTGFTSSVRTEIIAAIDAMSEFFTIKEKWILPLADMNEMDEILLIKSRIIGNHDCQECWECLDPERYQDTRLIECGQSHITKELKKCKGVKVPLDTIMKWQKIKPVTRDPEPTYFAESESYLLSWIYEQDPYKMSRKMFRKFHGVIKRILRGKMTVLLPTKASYKWDLMLSLVQSVPYKAVIVLGDGTGFTSSICARRFPLSKIYPTALLEKSKIIPQDLKSIKPFASRVYSNICGNLIENVNDDILSPLWKSEFCNFVQSLGCKCLIISDVEAYGEVEKRLSETVKILKEMKCCDFIFKVYLKSFDTDMNLSFYSNWLCNLSYQEGFVSNVNIELQECTETSIDTNVISIPSGDVLEKYLLEFHQQYTELCGISIKIALNTFYKNLLPISLNDIKNSRGVIIVRFLSYLSANFKFPHMAMPIADNRRLLDGMITKLIKSIKMVLITLYGEEITQYEYFSKLTLVQTERKKRQKLLKSFLIQISVGEKSISISKREISAALVLRSIYLSQSFIEEITIIPDSLGKLYSDVILPGLSTWNDIKLF